MKKEKIAVQLYSVRDYCNDAHEIVETLKTIRSIGYKAVELSSVGPLPPHELARVLDGEGLTCCATHEDVEELLTDPESVIERLQVLGCSTTVYPFPRAQDFSTAEGVKRLGKALNRSGKIFAKAGVTFAYHNHNLEFHRLNGKTVFEMLMAETDPKAVAAELDTYWVQAGGGDPVDWLGTDEDPGADPAPQGLRGGCQGQGGFRGDRAGQPRLGTHPARRQSAPDAGGTWLSRTPTGRTGTRSSR